MKRLQLEGIYPPIPTPFNEDESVSEAGLTRNLEFLGRFDLSGYVVLGSNGEAVHLSEKETNAFLEMTRDRIPRDRLMIVGTGRASTRRTLALTSEAAEVGADAALVLPPSYYRGQMTKEALTQHFRAVAEESEIPIVIYNMPACTGIDLDAETVLAIAEHPNVCGIKDSGGNVAKLAAIRRDAEKGFAILAGSASFLLPALAVGADGGVVALANIAPQQCLDLWGAAERGEWERARVMQQELVHPNDAVTRIWGVGGLKAALDLIGLYGGVPRSPLPILDPDRRIELERILNKAGIGPVVLG